MRVAHASEHHDAYPSDIDLWRSAGIMIRQYGSQAPTAAADRAKRLEKSGDKERAATLAADRAKVRGIAAAGRDEAVADSTPPRPIGDDRHFQGGFLRGLFRHQLRSA